VSIIEHFVELGLQKSGSKQVSQPAQWWTVVNLVPEDCAARAIVQEVMPMQPVGERAMDLTVGDELARHVLGVLGHPGQGEGADLGLEDDPGTRIEGAGRKDDAYVLPGGDQRLESPGPS
jgi:hypothetical protein